MRRYRITYHVLDKYLRSVAQIKTSQVHAYDEIEAMHLLGSRLMAQGVNYEIASVEAVDAQMEREHDERD